MKNVNFKPTHHGHLHGIPVLVDARDESNPAVEAKYQLGFALITAELVFDAVAAAIRLFDPSFAPEYTVHLTEKIASTLDL